MLGTIVVVLMVREEDMVAKGSAIARALVEAGQGKFLGVISSWGA
jgi:hypothetical protein